MHPRSHKRTEGPQSHDFPVEHEIEQLAVVLKRLHTVLECWLQLGIDVPVWIYNVSGHRKLHRQQMCRCVAGVQFEPVV